VEIVVDVNKRKCLEKYVPRQRNNLWGNNNWKFVVCRGVVGLHAFGCSVVIVVVVVVVKSSS
jgi:hypothetical protein